MGIEPISTASEAAILSIELQAQHGIIADWLSIFTDSF